MTSRRGKAQGWALLPPMMWILSLPLLAAATAAAAPAAAQSNATTAPNRANTGNPANADEYAYIARPGDTLIGLSKRLLREPNRWHEVQLRNHIGNEFRIPPGSAIRIPYSWLKVTAEAATVAKVAGTATTAGQRLATGQSLAQGSLVETGPDGSVAIDLADGSQIILHKSSSLRLSEMQHIDGVPNSHDVQLQLPDGHADTLVKPHRDVGRFEIVTPTAALAVRGTVFRTNTLAAEGTVTTETLEGVVAVSASGATVDTKADFGTRVDKGAPPLKPVPLLPAPELSGVQGTNGQKEWHFAFAPVEGAKAYHVQISDDPEFRTFVADVRTEQPAVDMAAPPDGAYWLRVRGIDSLGLEGHDAVKAITQQLIPEPPPPPPPEPRLVAIHRHDLQFEWNAEPGQQYRVQIARDAKFRHILTDQTQSEGNLTWHRPWPGTYYIRVAQLPPQESPPANSLQATPSAAPEVTSRGSTSPDRAPDGAAQGTAFTVPVPLWMRIAAPIVILTPLLL